MNSRASCLVLLAWLAGEPTSFQVTGPVLSVVSLPPLMAVPSHQHAGLLHVVNTRRCVRPNSYKRLHGSGRAGAGKPCPPINLVNLLGMVILILHTQVWPGR
jgi:hypothetical protein